MGDYRTCPICGDIRHKTSRRCQGCKRKEEAEARARYVWNLRPQHDRIDAGPLRELLVHVSPTELQAHFGGRLKSWEKWWGRIVLWKQPTVTKERADKVTTAFRSRLIVDDSLDWQERAACREHPQPDIWFADPGTEPDLYALACQVCATCPVREACLRYANETDTRYGIWGGKSFNDRTRTRARRSNT